MSLFFFGAHLPRPFEFRALRPRAVGCGVFFKGHADCTEDAVAADLRDGVCEIRDEERGEKGGEDCFHEGERAARMPCPL